MDPSALLDRREQELFSLLAQRGSSQAAAPKDGLTDAGGAVGTSTTLGASNPCENICRAYSSMLTAAGKLCDLAGESDDRCLAAKDRVKSAQRRIASSTCPACPDK